MAVVDIVFQDNFERGVDGLADAGRFDSEQDTATPAQLDFPHYTELARVPGMPMPFTGAYCMRVVLAGQTEAATVTEADINMANGETHWFKFEMWVDPDFATNTTADDTFVIFETQGAGNVVSFAFGMKYVNSTGLLDFAIGELTPTSATTGGQVPLGQWFTVELSLLTDTDSADGAVNLYVTPYGAEPSSTATATVGSIQNIAATHGVLGVQDHLATTQGTILFNGIMMDSASRIWPTKDRFSEVIRMTQSGHVVLGPGTVESILSIQGSGGDNVVEFFDTDVQNINPSERKTVCSSATAYDNVEGLNTPFEFTRGLFYHDSDGTNVDGTYALGTSQAETFITISRAPNWFSDGNIRRFASRRNVSA
jgi:hypothetical protein